MYGMQSTAQISPGPLSQAHAHLEGLSNCTKCHTLGDKVSNDKCLDCHHDLRGRIDARQGYHYSAEVRGKDCFTCHSDHHGRNFQIVRFDAQRFDHGLTGYPLTGAHRTIDCRQCHTADHIADRQIREKPNTYLGLNTACASCHDDPHRGTLAANCASCHSTTAFAPASGFSHDKTDFPLRGAHRNVDCIACHPVTQMGGSSFQQFDGIPFANCSSCHTDVHNGRFGTNCKECHVEESFRTFRGMTGFNHNRTKFPLAGAHRNVACADCHDTRVTADRMFKDFTGRDVQNCVSCHEDVHAQKFGTDCRACHTEQSFQSILNLSAFDHTLTGYPLEGMHAQVDCRSCHEAKMTAPLSHTHCMDCHTDYHEGVFVTAYATPDCASCHTPEGFSGSTFSIERHNESRFALTGAHLATPCLDCHLSDDKWYFRNIGMQCIDCHEDIHRGTIAEQYNPAQTCTTCHLTDAWSMVSFDHAPTGFAIEGAHLRQACTACHVPDAPESSASRSIVFTGLTGACNTCHTNVHREQFVVDGVTDCRRCHDEQAWIPSGFDHSTARFALEGAHLLVACDRCHRTEEDAAGRYTVYRLEGHACADCHQ